VNISGSNTLIEVTVELRSFLWVYNLNTSIICIEHFFTLTRNYQLRQKIAFAKTVFGRELKMTPHLIFLVVNVKIFLLLIVAVNEVCEMCIYIKPSF